MTRTMRTARTALLFPNPVDVPICPTSIRSPSASTTSNPGPFGSRSTATTPASSSSPRPSSSSGSSAAGIRTDADGDAEFRLITSDDYESVLLGRSGPDEEGWTIVGEVTEAESAEE